jgi:hypothetical protein
LMPIGKNSSRTHTSLRQISSPDRARCSSCERQFSLAIGLRLAS